MKQPGPLLTLVAGVVLAAGIATANYANDSGIQPVAGSAPAVPAVSSTPSAAVSPAPGASKVPPSAAPSDAASASSAPPDAVSSAPAPPAEAPVKTAPPRRANYTGRVNGGGASIAVSVQGDRAIAYLCDGRRAEAWLNGTVTEGRLDLKNAKGDSLAGDVRKSSVAGTVKVGAKSWQFSAPKVARPAGLYRAIPKGKDSKGSAGKAGWIVQPDGSQVGVITSGTTSKPAPHLDFGSKATSVNGTRVTVESVDGPAEAGGSQ
jgi:hypothetical protein